MTNEEKHSLIRNMYRVLFAIKAEGRDAVTVRVQNRYIVNGKPLIDANGVRVGGEVHGTMFKDSSTGEKTICGFDIDLQDGNKILQLRFIEQNPNKRNDAGQLKPMAIAARNGSKIMWVIDREAKTNNFLGRMQDGVWTKSNMQAVQKVSKVQNAVPGVVPVSASLIPNNEEDVDELLDTLEEIPEIEDMPDWLLEKYANEEPDEYLMDEL